MHVISETVWQSRNNVIEWTLFDDSVDGVLKPSNLESVTKVELVEDGTVVATSEGTSFFDWSAGNGLLVVKLANAGLAARPYDCELVLYDAVNTAGIVYGEVQLMVRG